MKGIKENIYLNNENLTLLLVTVVKDQMKIQEKNYMNKENNIKKIHIRWSSSEDEMLKELVNKYGTKDWKKISSYLEGRSPIQCFYRWNKVLRNSYNIWTEIEDSIIKQFVAENGSSNWTKCAKLLKYRTSNQIKRHWFNDLAQKENLVNLWTEEDEMKLLLNTSAFGTCWSKMRHLFPGRDEISIKNKFNSILRRTASKSLTNENNKEGNNVFSLKQNELIKFIPFAIRDISQNLQNNNSKFRLELDNYQSNSDSLFTLDNIQKMYFCAECKEVIKKKMKEKLCIILYQNCILNQLTERIENLKSQEMTIQKIEKLKTIVMKLKHDFNTLQKNFKY